MMNTCNASQSTSWETPIPSAPASTAVTGGAMRLRTPLTLLLVVANTAGLSLGVPELPEEEADGTCGKGVRLGRPTVLLVGGAEAADEGVE